jgi:hypothetical protein
MAVSLKLSKLQLESLSSGGEVQRIDCQVARRESIIGNREQGFFELN